MKHSILKSMLVFTLIIAALGVTGYWLNSGGWLEVPRIFDVPAVLSGEESSGMAEGRGPGDSDRPMPDENRMPREDAQGFKRDDGGLNWDMLPGVLANLWIIALIIAVVVYSTRVLAFVSKRLPFRHTAVLSVK